METGKHRWGWKWWTLAWLAIGVSVYVSHRYVSRSRVTERNLRHVAIGMTAEQVESILGPPTEEQSVPLSIDRRSELTLRRRSWQAPRFRISVWFDPSDRVDCVTGGRLGPEPPPWGQLLEQLGW